MRKAFFVALVTVVLATQLHGNAAHAADAVAGKRREAAVGTRAPAGGAAVTWAELGPEPGEVVGAENIERFRAFLPPGLEWAVRFGWRLTVAKARRIELPSKYREATDRYSRQVRLGHGGATLENYTAGLPFPDIDPKDEHAAQKIMWNFNHNISAIDDEVQLGVDTYTGSIQAGKPIRVERHILAGAYRKLFYTGRIFVDPKPTRPNPDGVRFKESLHPLLAPFDLAGVGFTAIRYLDPDKQDDAWVYFPQMRRTRGGSRSPQRSDSLFGQDTDFDALRGFNGKIAQFEFRLLGEQTILASMHATHRPAQWQQPEGWMWADTWEPRRVFVIEARPKNDPVYAYSKRVLFVDREAWIIPQADSYDRAGQLWKAHFLKWDVRRDPKSKNPDPAPCQDADVVVDVQLQHGTSTAIPREATVPDGGYHSNVGEAMGVTEEFFTVQDLIGAPPTPR